MASKGEVERVGSRAEALDNARRLLATDPAAAVEQTREIVGKEPGDCEAQLILALGLRRLGDTRAAREAEAEALELSSLSPKLLEAAMKLADNRLDVAERLVRSHLEERADDPVGLRLLAEIALRTGNFDAADQIARRGLALAPDYQPLSQLIETARQFRIRLGSSGGMARSTVPIALDSTADSSSVATNYAAARQLYETAVRRHPDRPDFWVSYGHVLRALGRQAEAMAAYRRSIDLSPTFGDPWWGLADLKSNAFDAADARQMLDLLARTELEEDDRIKLHFAVARAFEQAKDFEAAFNHFAAGNKARAAQLGFDAGAVRRHVDKSAELFTTAFFSEREGAGFEASDPIFVIGMPRSGSTLVEQILSSHPMIEATMELPDIPALATHLGGRENAGLDDSPYLDNLASLDPAELRRFGQSYIWSSGLRRTTGRPYFIDKMPNNWLHVGLILAILPKARIIDARRHPLDCGMSNYRQLFGHGQAFTYDLRDFGRYYSEYVRLMSHFDALFPGRIFRVIHEQLIDSPEEVTRSMLDYVGVDFDEACLNFHENRRAVRTASSEQVRRPLNREGVDQWKKYEKWIGELRDELAPIADSYPSVPAPNSRP